MITNATLNRVDAPTLLNGGDTSFAAGAAIAYRCCLQGISRAVQPLVDAAKVEADTEMYVALADWPTANQSLVPQCQVLVTPDPIGANVFPQGTYLIQMASLMRGGLTSVRCILRSK